MCTRKQKDRREIMGNHKEAVNHPAHYNIPGKKECIEQMKEDYGDLITVIFCLTNAYKYLYRAGHKDSADEDIEKAKWYYNYCRTLDGSVGLLEIFENINSLLDYIGGELEE